MVKNDYRRSLILLRTHAQGFSGHVRLERRTLLGSMFFVVNAPAGSGTLCAALIRHDARGAYFAARLGELRRDGRGQATLAYSFDPRSIDGRPLEDYLLIAIVAQECDRCEMVLSGNVNGSREVSWSSVRAAACEACACGRGPACDLRPPRPQPRSAVPETASGEPPANAPSDNFNAPDSAGAATGDASIPFSGSAGTPADNGGASALLGDGANAAADGGTSTPSTGGAGAADVPADADGAATSEPAAGETSNKPPAGEPSDNSNVPVASPDSSSAVTDNGGASSPFNGSSGASANNGGASSLLGGGADATAGGGTSTPSTSGAGAADVPADADGATASTAVSMATEISARAPAPEAAGSASADSVADIAGAIAMAAAQAVPAHAPTAGESLGIDMAVPWPGVSEQLRGLFARQPADELMLGDGYTYVRAPMPTGSGYDHVEIGVRVRDGAPDSIAYALPARFSPEPPPGLEDYVWRGGAADGWWTIRTDPDTGERQA